MEPAPHALRVAGCTHEAAKYAVLHWHYSRSIPSGKLVKYGVWEDDRFIGAVIFGRGASVPLATTMRRKFGLDITEWAELVRVALDKHETPTTQIVAAALRRLKADSPGVRLVISFADPEEGHSGTLYQAGNWVYAGRSAAVTQWWMGGRWIHQRSALAQLPGSEVRAAGTATRRREGKHRYYMPLDRAMRRRVVPLALPFPRGARLDGEPSDLRSEGAGSTPASRSTTSPHPTVDK